MKRLLVILLIFAFCIILYFVCECRKKKNIKDIYNELKENPDVQEVYHKISDEILPEIQQIHENIISHEKEAKNQYEDIKNMYYDIQDVTQKYKSQEDEIKKYYGEFQNISKDYNYIKSQEDDIKKYYDELRDIDKVITYARGKPLKKLYNKFQDIYDNKFNIKCMSNEGKQVAPIKTPEGYKCEHYYITTNRFNGLPFSQTVNGNTCELGNVTTRKNYFDNCNANSDSENSICPGNNNQNIPCDISNWNDQHDRMMYAAYGAPSDGITSGYRVDYPADINHPIFLRVENTDAAANFHTSSTNFVTTTTETKIEDCEARCNSLLDDTTGCFVYKYSPSTQQCTTQTTNFNNGYSFVRA